MPAYWNRQNIDRVHLGAMRCAVGTRTFSGESVCASLTPRPLRDGRGNCGDVHRGQSTACSTVDEFDWVISYLPRDESNGVSVEGKSHSVSILQDAYHRPICTLNVANLLQVCGYRIIRTSFQLTRLLQATFG